MKSLWTHRYLPWPLIFMWLAILAACLLSGCVRTIEYVGTDGRQFRYTNLGFDTRLGALKVSTSADGAGGQTVTVEVTELDTQANLARAAIEAAVGAALKAKP